MRVEDHWEGLPLEWSFLGRNIEKSQKGNDHNFGVNFVSVKNLIRSTAIVSL